jgi:hypothetical protein
MMRKTLLFISLISLASCYPPPAEKRQVVLRTETGTVVRCRLFQSDGKTPVWTTDVVPRRGVYVAMCP